MKIALRRIIGFIEFILGCGPAIGVYRLLFDEKYIFNWKFLFGIPLSFLFLKYGWRWMFNTTDITDEKELKPDDIFYRDAVVKAKSDIELFISYLSKGVFECRVLVPLKNKKAKRTWVQAEYLDSANINILLKKGRYIKQKLPVNDIEDWYVNKDEVIVGLYTIKALADKALSNGYTLNWKSKRILGKIIN